MPQIYKKTYSPKKEKLKNQTNGQKMHIKGEIQIHFMRFSTLYVKE